MSPSTDTSFGEILSGAQLLSLLDSNPSLWEDIQDLWGAAAEKRMKTSEEHRYAVVFANVSSSKIIGLAYLVKIETPKSMVIGTVHNVIVNESFRGQGLGRKLMELVIEYSRNNNFDCLELTSRPFRIAANALYKKIGFELQASAVGENGTNFYRYFFTSDSDQRN